MNAALTAALKEAYVLAPSNLAILDTLQFSHPALPGGDLYIVKNTEDLTMTLEDTSSHLFKACGFQITLPQSGDQGLQQLPIVVDNVLQVFTDFINLIKSSSDRCSVTYRPYLSSDLTTPQMIPPLVLYLTDIVVTETQVQGNCTFMDILNKPFPSELYTRQRFPGLATA